MKRFSIFRLSVCVFAFSCVYAMEMQIKEQFTSEENKQLPCLNEDVWQDIMIQAIEGSADYADDVSVLGIEGRADYGELKRIVSTLAKIDKKFNKIMQRPVVQKKIYEKSKKILIKYYHKKFSPLDEKEDKEALIWPAVRLDMYPYIKQNLQTVLNSILYGEKEGLNSHLHDATLYGAYSVLKLLLKNGVNINANTSGLAPLHFCIEKKIARLLVEHGALVPERFLKTNNLLDEEFMQSRKNQIVKEL